MKIDSVEITNFRGIASGKLEGFGRINLLIGKNNSGKSTVIEAIARAISAHQNVTDIRGHAVSHVFAETRNEQSPADPGLIMLDQPIALVRVNGGVSGTLTLERSQNRLSTTTTNPTPVFRWPIGIFFSQEANDHRIEDSLWAIVVQRRFDKALKSDLSDVYEKTIDSLQMAGGDILIGYEERGPRLDLQGTGFRAALRWLLIVAASRGGVVFTEEPECFQHPSALKKLAAAITNRAIADDTQFFITTHSLECVRAFADAAPDTEKDKPWPFACFALERDSSTGVMTSRRLAKETVLGLDEAGTDVRFLEDYQ